MVAKLKIITIYYGVLDENIVSKGLSEKDVFWW